MIHTIKIISQLSKPLTPSQQGRVRGGWVAALFAFLLLLASCNGIPEDERLIYVEPTAAPQTPESTETTDTIETPDTPQIVQTLRYVLIEDFTGQRCVNCPNAATEIEQLKDDVKTLLNVDAIIAVGIHSGPLALYSRGNILGLRTEEGDAYYDHWGIEQEPIGYINRRGGISTVDKWSTLVREAIQQLSDVHLSLDVSSDAETRKAEISLEIANAAATDGYVQLWITENNITALQMMPDGSANQTYLHQHVFRRTVNGLWGDAYKAEAGVRDTLTYSCELDEAWVLENLNVVAFVYNNDGVQQVTEAKLNQ